MNQNEIKVMLDKALAELRSAENYFNLADEPELIEYAIFDLEASRRKYAYTLKKAKQMTGDREKIQISMD